MAVTQQLVRAPEWLLDRACESEGVLDRVCSFDPHQPTEGLDVDWAPGSLIAGAVAFPMSEDDRVNLRRAFNGDFVINPSYYDVDLTPTGIRPSGVREVAETLSRLVQAGYPSEEATSAAFARHSEIPDDPQSYLRKHLEAVAEFYEGAARESLAMFAWWD